QGIKEHTDNLRGTANRVAVLKLQLFLGFIFLGKALLNSSRSFNCSAMGLSLINLCSKMGSVGEEPKRGQAAYLSTFLGKRFSFKEANGCQGCHYCCPIH